MIRCMRHVMDRWSLAAIGVASSILLLFGSKHTRARRDATFADWRTLHAVK
jgi:hypothetical protein